MPAPVDPFPKVDLSKYLVDWRRHNDMTLLEVSAASGLAVSALNRWENGLRRMTLDTLHTLAEVYGVSPAALLGPAPPLAKGGHLPVLPVVGGRQRSIFPKQDDRIVIGETRLKRMESALNAMFGERKRHRKLFKRMATCKTLKETQNLALLALAPRACEPPQLAQSRLRERLIA